MTSLNLLSRKEELILLAIWKLGDDAYGMTIRDKVTEITAVKWLFGSIYTPLSQLYDKGLITKTEGESSAERGGRPRIFFKLTDAGIEALSKVKEVNASLWADIPPLTTK